MKRTIGVLALCVPCLLGAAARAQSPLEFGSPQAAFAGGPIRLTMRAATILRGHYLGDKVPLIPQPFRGRLDAALLAEDWPRVKAQLGLLREKEGASAPLYWEQSRLVATGSLSVAELHALDVAATGSTGLSETAAMMWFYAVAVTMTDGEKCVDAAARDAHLEYLRGPTFAPVLGVIRALADDRVAAMRELAIRLETALAEDRTDDAMCRVGEGKPAIKPDPEWRPEAVRARTMLPRDLLALTGVVRPATASGQEPAGTNTAPSH